MIVSVLVWDHDWTPQNHLFTESSCILTSYNAKTPKIGQSKQAFSIEDYDIPCETMGIWDTNEPFLAVTVILNSSSIVSILMGSKTSKMLFCS